MNQKSQTTNFMQEELKYSGFDKERKCSEKDICHYVARILGLEYSCLLLPVKDSK